jgi:hypothetical protein
MPWTYEQSTGVLLNPDGEQIAVGYSGAKGPSLNNPEREHLRGSGPIPRGRYEIRPARTSRAVGPIALDLVPVGHTAHGRSALMIHGDNRHMNRTASSGCIVLGRWARIRVSKSPDRQLNVV